MYRKCKVKNTILGIEKSLVQFQVCYMKLAKKITSISSSSIEHKPFQCVVSVFKKCEANSMRDVTFTMNPKKGL